LDRIQGCLDNYRERLLEAEHGRASTEIRVHRLSSQYKQMSEIVSGLSDPVIAVDQFDELILANRSAQHLFHIAESSTEKRALNQLVACEALIDLVTDTCRRAMPVQRTTEIAVHSDDDTRHYRVTCTGIVTTANGSSGDTAAAHGAVAVMNDISHEKAIQKRNAEFVSAVSHEMKTPLAGIKAYVELLVDGEAEDDATRDDFLEIINGQAERLQRLIDNLLNLARMEAGVVEVKKETRSLNELLDEAAGVVQPAAEEKQIELRSELSPMYLAVLADRDMILQAAINLLSNAIKYTPPGGSVTLRSQMEDNHAIFEVEDTGVGLSEEDRERVFEKFYRVKKDRNMAAGTGLGLPLAKHIIEDVHGGLLTVQSTLGEGSTFRVQLPCVSSHVYGQAVGK
jgi:two-component system phosphate regulon sensor histidine kinase PhoR